MQYVSLLVYQAILSLGAALITDPRLWPEFENMRTCAQSSFGYCTCTTVSQAVGCLSPPWWPCTCEHFSAAIVAISSIASSSCSGDQQDVASATSILNGFCAQLLQPPPTGPESPTLGNTISLTPVTITTVATQVTVTPSCTTHRKETNSNHSRADDRDYHLHIDELRRPKVDLHLSHSRHGPRCGSVREISFPQRQDSLGDWDWDWSPIVFGSVLDVISRSSASSPIYRERNLTLPTNYLPISTVGLGVFMERLSIMVLLSL